MSVELHFHHRGGTTCSNTTITNVTTTTTVGKGTVHQARMPRMRMVLQRRRRRRPATLTLQEGSARLVKETIGEEGR